MTKPNMSDVLMDEIIKKVNEHCANIFKDIAETYDAVDYDTLMNKYCIERPKTKQIKKKPTKKCTICMAKKADGFQCTRRKKPGGDYCGKHIKKLKFGRIDDELRYSDKSKYIKTKRENIDGEYYLVDDQNLVYSCSKTHPLLLGKKVIVNGEPKLISTKKYIEQRKNSLEIPIKIEIV